MEKKVSIDVLQKTFQLLQGEVKRYFKNHSKNVQPTYPPLNPKAGEVYLRENKHFFLSQISSSF